MAAIPVQGSAAGTRERAHALLIGAKPLREQVTLYKEKEARPLDWIHTHAERVMTRENFAETQTVFGLVHRVNAITNSRWSRIAVPPELLDELEESLKIRSIVSAKYRALLHTSLAQDLVEANRRKTYFYRCLRLCYLKLKAYSNN